MPTVRVHLSAFRSSLACTGGACAWSDGLDRTGILLNDLTPGRTPFHAKFTILATGRRPLTTGPIPSRAIITTVWDPERPKPGHAAAGTRFVAPQPLKRARGVLSQSAISAPKPSSLRGRLRPKLRLLVAMRTRHTKVVAGMSLKMSLS
jgi:hypothetical protein